MTTTTANDLMKAQINLLGAHHGLTQAMARVDDLPPDLPGSGAARIAIRQARASLLVSIEALAGAFSGGADALGLGQTPAGPPPGGQP